METSLALHMIQLAAVKTGVLKKLINLTTENLEVRN